MNSPTRWPDAKDRGAPLFRGISQPHLLIRDLDEMNTPEMFFWHADTGMWSSANGQNGTPEEVSEIYSYHSACLTPEMIGMLRAWDYNLCHATTAVAFMHFINEGDRSLDEVCPPDVARATACLNAAKATERLGEKFLQFKDEVGIAPSLPRTPPPEMVLRAALAVAKTVHGPRPEWTTKCWKSHPDWNAFKHLSETALQAALT